MSRYQRFTSGPTYRYQDTTFYAMNGYICLHYEDSDEFRVLNCREWLERTEALNLEAKRLQVQTTLYPNQKSIGELRKKIQRGVNMMGACFWDAKDQGDHEDPAVSAWFQRHRPWSRDQAKPQSRHADFSSPQIPAMQLGRDTGRRATPDHYNPERSNQKPAAKRKLVLPANLF